ncbi:MAG TPA: GNAT family N-acetyltransferase [Humisphaera sp.]
MEAVTPAPIEIRPFRACDAAACRRLFAEGRLGDRGPDADDPGTDVEFVEKHYLGQGSGFWVATAADGPIAGEVVGMIGVLRHDDGTAEVRRLRVDARYRRRGIGAALVEEALRFCQAGGYLRIIMDTYMERQPAVQLFQKFRFQHGRTRQGKTKDRLYFYLDLYGGDGRHQASGEGAADAVQTNG